VPSRTLAFSRVQAESAHALNRVEQGISDMEVQAAHPRIQLGPEVSIGISAYGNHVITQHCLDSLFRSARGEFELILVDDCSPDNGEVLRLFRAVAERHANTRVFRFTRNLEYSGSLNCILSHATGSAVMFLSNDIYVAPRYLSTLIEAAATNDRLGIVRGVSNFVDNDQASHNIDCGDHVKSTADISAFAEAVYQQHKHNTVPDNYLVGDAFLVTRKLLDAIGTFDPMFYGYFADPDFSVRAHRAGFECVLAQGAFAFHHRAANFDYLPEEKRKHKLEMRWAKVFENWARFKLKYGLPVEQMYSAVNDIDWRSLNEHAAQGADLYVPPVDYSEYLLK
jgi:GT2 family glycosyltransferase